MTVPSLKTLTATALLLAGGGAAQAGYQGTFAHDNELAFFLIEADGSALNTLRSYGYAGGVMDDASVVSDGGFDPVLTLYDHTGHLIPALEPDGYLNDDGAGVPTDPATGEAFDSLYEDTLAFGTYWLVLSQSNNYGENYLGDGFAWDDLLGEPSSTFGCTNGIFCDFTGANRTGGWALDILGFTSVTPKTLAEVQAAFPATPPPPPPTVPEPGTLALCGLGLAGLWRRRAA